MYLKDYLVEKNWYKTDATVVDYDVSNSKNVWTELEYNYDEEEYSTKIKGHSNTMRKNSELKIYVNPNNPIIIKVAKNLYNIAGILFKCSLVFIGVIVVIVPHYITKKRQGN